VQMTSTDTDGTNADTGFVRFANGGKEEDLPLGEIWNSSDSNQRIPDNQTYSASVSTGDYNRVVLKFSSAVTAVNGARAYYSRPLVDNVSNPNIYTVGSRTVDIDTGTKNDNNSVAFDSVDGSLIFAFPMAQWSAFNSGQTLANHILVIDNVTINNAVWTIQLTPPSSAPTITSVSTSTTVNSADTANLPGVTYYRKVYLPQTDNVSNNIVGTATTSEVSWSNVLHYSEPLRSASITANSDGSNYYNSDSDGVSDDAITSGGDILDLATTASSSNSDNGTSTVTVKLVSDFGESTSVKHVGHNSSYTVTAIDYDNETSAATFTFKRGHGYNVGGYPAILNEISGDAAIGGN